MNTLANFKISKLAYERGFRATTAFSFNKKGDLGIGGHVGYFFGYRYPQPTLLELTTWLREEWGILVLVDFAYANQYAAVIRGRNAESQPALLVGGMDVFEDYYNAMADGILETLRILSW